MNCCPALHNGRMTRSQLPDHLPIATIHGLLSEIRCALRNKTERKFLAAVFMCSLDPIQVLSGRPDSHDDGGFMGCEARRQSRRCPKIEKRLLDICMLFQRNTLRTWRFELLVNMRLEP